MSTIPIETDSVSLTRWLEVDEALKLALDGCPRQDMRTIERGVSASRSLQWEMHEAIDPQGGGRLAQESEALAGIVFSLTDEVKSLQEKLNAARSYCCSVCRGTGKVGPGSGHCGWCRGTGRPWITANKGIVILPPREELLALLETGSKS